jgi:hypothetical protein
MSRARPRLPHSRSRHPGVAPTSPAAHRIAVAAFLVCGRTRTASSRTSSVSTKRTGSASLRASGSCSPLRGSRTLPDPDLHRDGRRRHRYRQANCRRHVDVGVLRQPLLRSDHRIVQAVAAQVGGRRQLRPPGGVARLRGQRSQCLRGKVDLPAGGPGRGRAVGASVDRTGTAVQRLDNVANEVDVEAAPRALTT